MPTKQPDKSNPRHPSPPNDKGKVPEARAPRTGAPASPPEALYRHIVETAQEGIWVTDSSGTITFANEIIAGMLGYDSPSEFVGRSTFDFMDKQARPFARARLKRRRAGMVEHYELKLLRRDGGDLWVLVAANPLLDVQDHFAGALKLFTDITQRRQAEHELEQVNRAYRTLSAGNQALLHAVDEDALLHQVCRAIHEVGGYNMAWIGYKIDDEAKTVRPMVWSGIGGDELPGAKFTWAETEQGRGPSGTAIRTGKPVVMQNLATDPNFITYRVRALELGHGSVAVFPLINEDVVLGILGVYAPDPDAFGENELRLLAEMAGDIGFGIGAQRKRMAYEQSQAALRESEQRFSRIFHASPVATVISRLADTRFVDVNDSMVALTGLTRDEMIGRTAQDLNLFVNLQVRPRLVRELRESGGYKGHEIQLRTKSGEIRDVITSTDVIELGGEKHVISMAYDITDLKRAEEEIRSLARFPGENPGPVLRVAPDGKLLYTNEAVLSLMPEWHLAVGQVVPPVLGDIVSQALGSGAAQMFDIGYDGQVYSFYVVPIIEAGYANLYGRDVTKRKQAEQALERSNRAYHTLSECNQALVRAEDEETLLKRVSEIITGLGGYLGAWVSFIQGDEVHRLPLAVTAGAVDDEFLSSVRVTQAEIEEGHGLPSLAILTGKPQVMQNIAAETLPANHPTRESMRRFGYGSVAVFPLVLQGQVIGVLGVLAADTDAFSEQEIALLTELSGDLGYGIQALRTRALHQKAEQALERQNQRLSTLYAVGQVVNSTLDVNKILDFVVDEAMRVTHAERGLALVVDLVTRTFERRSLRGFTSADTARAEELRLKLDQGLNGQAYQTRRIVRVDDVHAHLEYYPLIESTRSELVAPIMRDDEVLGNIDLQSPEVGAFREVDTDYLRALAEQAALAIFNARLYHELEAYSEVLEQAVAERTAEVEATKDRVETILTSIGDALLVLRMDGRIEQVNSAFERQTCYSAVEAELKDHHDLLNLEFGSKGDYQAALETLTPGQVWQGETKVHRKDGSAYDASLTVAPVRDPRGAIRLLVAIIRDITPLKEVERAKDQFVSNVSHELRTPITSLRLNHDLIRRNPAGQERYVERMGREIDRLNDLIEDLLRLSRLDQGQVQLDLKPLDLNGLAAQYVDDRTPLAESRELNLIFESTSGLAPVMGDDGLLGQALSVLLTNALNYTPAGGKITIGTHQRETASRAWAGFSVSDSGPGIPPAELSQLFTRFFRGSVGRKSGAPGTGLGLAIAREIVERHAGHIEVASEGVPGKGATFSVWLPVTNSHPSSTAKT